MKNEKHCSCGHSPIIVLPGINHSPTHLYDENGNAVKNSKGEDIGGTLFFLDTDSVKKLLPNVGKKLILSLITQRDAGLGKAVYDVACKAFSYQECDTDGNFVKNLKTDRWNYSMAEMDKDRVEWVYRMVPMKSLVDVIGKDHTYFFTFNLVGDPMDSAAELNDYIQMVKEQTGHDKVILLPVSLGGTILTAYMDSFGKESNYSDIDMIVNAVACLDGTDIVADIYNRDFRIDDRFLHHEFIPAVLKEETGKATAGYIINSLLHLLPKSAFNAVLSNAVSGVIDTVMADCPQMWAMLPSARYDSVAAKYLETPGRAKLRERTDRFQQARLNLKGNLLDAVKTGVKVNSISGSNLNFGEVEYSFFAGVKSYNKYNTDGIINLSSTTLGATGAENGRTLPEDYEQAAHPEHNYISKDRKIDVSTALLPEHTWIFLNQHHEVGKNDVVLNLAKALVLGEVNSVHDDPVKYPQFNGSCLTWHLRRWRLPDAIKALDDIKNGTLKCTEELKEKLEAAAENALSIITSTIADADAAKKAVKEIEDLLSDLGRFTPAKSPTEKELKKEKRAEKISEYLAGHLGGGSIVDKILRR